MKPRPHFKSSGPEYVEKYIDVTPVPSPKPNKTEPMEPIEESPKSGRESHLEKFCEICVKFLNDKNLMDEFFPYVKNFNKF